MNLRVKRLESANLPCFLLLGHVAFLIDYNLANFLALFLRICDNLFLWRLTAWIAFLGVRDMPFILLLVSRWRVVVDRRQTGRWQLWSILVGIYFEQSRSAQASSSHLVIVLFLEDYQGLWRFLHLLDLLLMMFRAVGRNHQGVAHSDDLQLGGRLQLIVLIWWIINNRLYWKHFFDGSGLSSSVGCSHFLNTPLHVSLLTL